MRSAACQSRTNLETFGFCRVVRYFCRSTAPESELVFSSLLSGGFDIEIATCWNVHKTSLASAFRFALIRRPNQLLIGIGGYLTTPPLPHHRTYGSIRNRGGSTELNFDTAVGPSARYQTGRAARAISNRLASG